VTVRSFDGANISYVPFFKKPFYEIDGPDIRVPNWNGQGYRLPTEVEWEYSCRSNASARARFSFGDDPLELGNYGWFLDNSERRTHPVSKKRPNVFGLYDMHGNVWEWCWDWADPDYYDRSPADDPTGPAGAAGRVAHGGSWNGAPRDARSARRHMNVPDFRWQDLGFRVVLGQSGR
jgi:formylglycine-generating enzyme